MSEESFVTPELESFVTVAEAARALGVDARQIRRWVDRLESKDKGQDTQRTHKGQPIVTVRLSSVKALQSGDSLREESKDTANGQSRDTTKCPVLVSDGSNHRQSDGMSTKLAEALRRAAVLEAERDGLTARLADAQKATADTASDRDAWKEQAGRLTEQASELTQALRAAQDEARAARVIGASRGVMQIEASGESPEVAQEKRPFWGFLRRGR